MLRRFGPDIWIADGPVTTVIGFRYPTRMAVIRLSDGSLFIWSPIQLSNDLRTQVDALGYVGHLVAPNSLHHLFIQDWQSTYTNAHVCAPPGLRKKRKDIEFHSDLGDIANPDWADDLDQVIVRGNAITTEVVFFHRKSSTVLFADLIQNFRTDWFTGWRAIVARMDLMVAPEPSVPRKFRTAFYNRRAARNLIQNILTWPAEKVIMAHGDPIENDGQAFIGRAFHWLNV